MHVSNVGPQCVVYIVVSVLWIGASPWQCLILVGQLTGWQIFGREILVNPIILFGYFSQVATLCVGIFATEFVNSSAFGMWCKNLIPIRGLYTLVTMSGAHIHYTTSSYSPFLCTEVDKIILATSLLSYNFTLQTNQLHTCQKNAISFPQLIGLQVNENGFLYILYGLTAFLSRN